jgi:PIN domain nuclease of toxin-antitoxin system
VKLLLDTHTLLWWDRQDSRLSERTRELVMDAENEIMLSAVSALEIAIKSSAGRLDLALSPGEYVESRTDLYRLTPLPVTIEHAVHVASLPRLHRDPFDRLIVAQAQVERVPIITNDPGIAAYDVETVW